MLNKYILSEAFGFENFEDFIGTVLTLKDKTIIPLISILLSIPIAFIEKIVNDYIYNPALGVLTLLIVSVLDTLLGMSVAVMNKEGIQPNKIVRSMIRFILQVLIVAIAYQSHIIQPVLIYKVVVDALLLLFTISTLWSSIKNAHKLGIITDDQYQTLEQIVSLAAFIKRLKSKFGENKKTK